MKTKTFFIFFVLFFLVFGCKKDDNNNGSHGDLGEIGNTWKVKVDGIYDLSTEIYYKSGDIYGLQVSWAKVALKKIKFGYTGNEVIDYVYSKGNESQPFTMVKFDAQVGDIYSINIDGVSHMWRKFLIFENRSLI